MKSKMIDYGLKVNNLYLNSIYRLGTQYLYIVHVLKLLWAYLEENNQMELVVESK